MNNKERYLRLLSSCTIKEFKQYISENESSIVVSPSTLLIPPMTNKVILHDDIINIIFDCYKKNNIDLNSRNYFDDRKDMLQGADLISGIILFSILYIIKVEKRSLEDAEINQIVRIIKASINNGWNVSNKLSNNMTIALMLEEFILSGNEELEVIYNELSVYNKGLEVATLDDKIIKSNQNNVVRNTNDKQFKKMLIDKYPLNQFLCAISIEGYIDSSIFNNSSLMANIDNIMMENDIISLHDYLKYLGLTSQFDNDNKEDLTLEISEEIKQPDKIDKCFSGENISETMSISSSKYVFRIDDEIEDDEILDEDITDNEIIDNEVVDDLINDSEDEKEDIVVQETMLAKQYVVKEDLSKNDYELISIIDSIQQMYSNQNKEENVTLIFLKNPQVTNYYFELERQSNSLFGCDLNSLFVKLGLVNNKNESKEEITPIAEEVYNDDSQLTEDVNQDDINVKEINMHDLEVLRITRLLDSIFVNRLINVIHMEGTTLYSRLQVLAEQYGYRNINNFLEGLGYTVDNDVTESYRLLLSRVYE